MGTITLNRIIQRDENKYSVLSNGFSLQCQFIQQINGILLLRNSQQSNLPITIDSLHNLFNYFHLNQTRMLTIFGLRCRATGGVSPVRYTINLINQIFSRWGFTKLSAIARKRQRNGETRVEVSIYTLSNEVGVNVYEHIKPITTRRNEDVHLPSSN